MPIRDWAHLSKLLDDALENYNELVYYYIIIIIILYYITLFLPRFYRY